MRSIICVYASLWHSDFSGDKCRRREEAAGCRDLHLQWPNDAYQEGSELCIPIPKSLFCLSEFLLHGA